MPSNEKELNNYLFDQLSAVERIEEALNRSEEEARKVIVTLKKEINRKLYQKPPLTEDTGS